MSEHDEESLGEATPSKGEAFGIVDTTPEVSAEQFDFDAFVQGIRPLRRSVKLSPRGDLIAVMDEIEPLLNELADEHQDPATTDARRKAILKEYAPLEDRLEEVRAEFNTSKRWFTVEARSGEWVDKFNKDEAAKRNITLPAEDSDDKLSAEDSLALQFAQLAEQTIAPAGVTVEGIRKMNEHAERELIMWMAAVSVVNTQRGDSAKVLTRDFSLRPFVKPLPARSSKSR